MVEINYRIVITGIICLATIYVSLILTGHDADTLGTLIVGAIAMSIGITLPSPKIDNNKGVLIW